MNPEVLQAREVIRQALQNDESLWLGYISTITLVLRDHGVDYRARHAAAAELINEIFGKEPIQPLYRSRRRSAVD